MGISDKTGAATKKIDDHVGSSNIFGESCLED
jgi:hypothetical protein